MTQRELILSAFKGGKRIRCTDAFPVYGISPHSFTRIVKELRDAGEPVLDVEIQPQNGGTAYKDYYYGAVQAVVARRQWRQVAALCACGGSYYQVLRAAGWVCNKCGKGV